MLNQSLRVWLSDQPYMHVMYKSFLSQIVLQALGETLILGYAFKPAPLELITSCQGHIECAHPAAMLEPMLIWMMYAWMPLTARIVLLNIMGMIPPIYA